MLDTLCTASSGSAKDVLDTVRKAVSMFMEKADQFDDLTMLCVDYKGQQSVDK